VELESNGAVDTPALFNTSPRNQCTKTRCMHYPGFDLGPEVLCGLDPSERIAIKPRRLALPPAPHPARAQTRPRAGVRLLPPKEIVHPYRDPAP